MAATRQVIMQCSLLDPALSYMWDHAVAGKALFPGAAFFEMASAAAQTLLSGPGKAAALTGATIPAPLPLPQLPAGPTQPRLAQPGAAVVFCRIGLLPSAVEIASAAQRSVHLLARMETVTHRETYAAPSASASRLPNSQVATALGAGSWQRQHLSGASIASYVADICEAHAQARDVFMSPAVLDSCLHLGAVQPAAGAALPLKLPAGVQAVVIPSTRAASYSATAWQRVASPALSVIDYTLASPAGGAGCAISGLEAKPLALALPQRGGKEHGVLYHIGWQASEVAATGPVDQAGAAAVATAALRGPALQVAGRALQLLTSDRLAQHKGLLLRTTAALPVTSLLGGSGMPTSGLLWGMTRAAALENPSLRVVGSDADPLLAGRTPRRSSVVAVVPTSAVGPGDAYGQATRSGLSLQATLLPSGASSQHHGAVPSIAKAAIKPGSGRLVITGGLGSLGSLMAAWAAEARLSLHLQLVGRSGKLIGPLPLLDQLLQSTAAETPAVTLLASDMACKEDSLAVTAGAAGAPLAGILHSGGVLADATLPNQSPKTIRAAFSAKLAALEQWRPSLAVQPAGVEVLFSSVAALLGSAGQANYSGANSLLDATAAGLQQQVRPRYLPCACFSLRRLSLGPC